jgi:hypothetical protein
MPLLPSNETACAALQPSLLLPLLLLHTNAAAAAAVAAGVAPEECCRVHGACSHLCVVRQPHNTAH